MLARQIERIQRSRRIDRLLVATSVDPSDDAIVSLCRELEVPIFRGSLDDVLDRFYQAARTLLPETVVRLTGDCPLTDPIVIDGILDLHEAGQYDYTSNTLDRRFPDGLDAEAVKLSCLASAWHDAALPSEREHVTPYIYNHPERFRLGNLIQPQDHSRWRWTVDEPGDFDFISAIYEALYPSNPAFGSADVQRLLARRPDIVALMGRGATNEGYEFSTAADAAAAAQSKDTC